MTAAKREFNPTHFSPNHAAEYARLVVKGEYTSVEHGGSWYRPATPAEKLAAGGVGEPDYSNTPRSDSVSDGNTHDWIPSALSEVEDDTGIIQSAAVHRNLPRADFRRYTGVSEMKSGVDYWPALQDAVEDATSRTGLDVYVQPGTVAGGVLDIDIASVLNVPSHSKFDFAGAALNIVGNDNAGAKSGLFRVIGTTDGICIDNLKVKDPLDTLQGLYGFNVLGAAASSNLSVDIELEGSGAGMVQTAAAIWISGEGEKMKLRGGGKYLGYGVRFNSGKTRTDLSISCNTEFCGVNSILLQGEIRDFVIEDYDIGLQHPATDAKHPITFSTSAGSSFTDFTIRNGVIEGLAGVAAKAGLANGAYGDLIAIRRAKNGEVYGNTLKHGGEFGIDIVDDCERIRVYANTLTDIDGSGLIIGGASGEAARKCEVFGNTFTRCGLNVDGSIPIRERAALRVLNASDSVVGPNTYIDNFNGEYYSTSERTHRSESVFIDCETDIVIDNDASFAPISAEKPPVGSIWYSALDGVDGNRYDSTAGLPNLKDAALVEDLIVSARLNVESVATGSVQQLFGAASRRYGLYLTETGQAQCRMQAADGTRTLTSAEPIKPNGRFWLRTRWDGNSGVFAIDFSNADVATEGQVSDWLEIAASTDATVGLNAGWDAVRLSIGHGAAGSTTSSQFPSRLHCYSFTGTSSGVKVFDFSAKETINRSSGGMKSMQGEVWNLIGSADVLQDSLVKEANSPTSGATADRPTSPALGQDHFDESLDRWIKWTGTTWHNGEGLAV